METSLILITAVHGSRSSEVLRNWIVAGLKTFCLRLVSVSSFSVPHTRSLEARIKEELVAQGLLDAEERPGQGGDSEDEVLAELQRRQAELKALSNQNRARKQELLR